MKKLIALVCMVAGAGCTSSTKPEVLSVRVESFARSDTRLEGTFVLLPSKEAEARPKQELDEITAFIERALCGRGLRRAERQETADFAVFAHFGATTRPVTRSRDELILSQRVVMPTVAPAVASIRYEPVGFLTHETSRLEDWWFLVLSVYDLQVFRSTSESRVIWEVGMSCESRGLSLIGAAPAMLCASIDRFASTTNPTEVRLESAGADIWKVRGSVELPSSDKEDKEAQLDATESPGNLR